MAWFSFSMEYLKDTEMSLTPSLNLGIEESRSGMKMILEQIIMQAMEKVDGRTIFFEQEPMHTPETNSKRELLPTPNMFPIIRPLEIESPFHLSETKISVLLDRTQDIILNYYFILQKYIWYKRSYPRTRRIAWVSLNKDVERHPKETN